MKQTGYIIENLLDKTKYFTSSSSYDRPQWVKKEQASVYESVDSAERAMKKMIKYGVNSIRMVNLAELSLPPQEELPPENDLGAAPPMDGELPPDEGNPEDEMVAGAQEEVCPECGHEPCTCEVHDQGEEIDIDALPPEDEMGELPPEDEMRLPPEENEEVTNRSTGLSRGHTVSYKGQEFVVVGDVGHGVVQIADKANPAKVQRVHSVDLLPVRESADDNENCDCGDLDAKVTVPATVKSGLAGVVTKFTKEADQYNGRDDARASFAMTVASAAQELLDLVSQGTVGGMKQAQIKLTSFMNPITSNFPADALKFVLSGGKKPTLKDLFDSKRAK